MNEEELSGRMQAVLVALRELFAELGRDAPLRKRVRDALITDENDAKALSPQGDTLHGMKQARKDMGL